MIGIVQTLRRWWLLLRIVWRSRGIRRATTEEGKLRAQQAMAALLADARGLPMKVGQVLAGVGGESPFRHLATGVKPLPMERVRPLVEASLEQPMESTFATFEESVAAASLGQVHRATLLDGTPVAVKVRYPHIDAAVKAELQLAGWVPEVGPVKTWGFDLNGYKRVLHSTLLGELDYLSEAQRQSDFRSHVEVDGLLVPKVWKELCRPGLLVQEFVSGVFLDDVKEWSHKERLKVARTLLVTLFQSLFVYGEVHGDPHQGNALYFRREDGEPVMALLDYGCTIPIARERRLALLHLIVATLEGRDTQPLSCFGVLGFDMHKLFYIKDKLPALCRILFQPFLQPRAFALEDWKLGASIQELLGEQKWWFRSAGPPELFLLMRAFQGLVLQMEALDVRLPWWPFVKRTVGESLLDEARSWTCPPLPPEFAGQAPSMKTIAHSLHVRVKTDGVVTVSMDFPSEAAAELERIIPDEVLHRIESLEDVSVLEMVEKVKATDFAPQDLFAWEDGSKQYRVWLA
ncbi:MAG: AarF/ABC1/UbiB kinase family protein [Deltaproteobacteria bacterium]|nr:MAG: AarF/ABC1/UbiB kinase family protein [Deltaproteobacteria bacterium]